MLWGFSTKSTWLHINFRFFQLFPIDSITATYYRVRLRLGTHSTACTNTYRLAQSVDGLLVFGDLIL